MGARRDIDLDVSPFICVDLHVLSRMPPQKIFSSRDDFGLWRCKQLHRNRRGIAFDETLLNTKECS